MSKIVHTSRVTITRESGPTRKAIIEGFDEPVYYGVHGGIRAFYRVDPLEEHAATLDHIVGAVGGCMMGTLAAELLARGIKTHSGVYRAEAEGDVEDVGGVLRITRIRVHYHLKTGEETRGDALGAFDAYLPFCPGARSVIGCIDIQHRLTFD